MKKLDVKTLATVAGGTICKPVCAPACPPAPCAPATTSCGTKSKKGC